MVRLGVVWFGVVWLGAVLEWFGRVGLYLRIDSFGKVTPGSVSPHFIPFGLLFFQVPVLSGSVSLCSVSLCSVSPCSVSRIFVPLNRSGKAWLAEVWLG